MSKDQVSAFALLTVAAAAGLVGWVCGAFDGEPRPGEYDATARSTDLVTDLKLMWETEPLEDSSDAVQGPALRASTDRAINAASRVFNTIHFAGKSRLQVSALLGHQNSARNNVEDDLPAPTEDMVYQFDHRAYGWQFKILFDAQGNVQEVQRHWIQ